MQHFDLLVVMHVALVDPLLTVVVTLHATMVSIDLSPLG
jgi:hypothetical protein